MPSNRHTETTTIRSYPALFRVMAAMLSLTLAWLAPGPVAYAGEGFADVAGGRLFYRSEGQGPVVILIHGGFLDQRMWDGQVPVLAPHYRVVRYDVRAHGQSPAEAVAFSDSDDLLALMDHLDIGTASIVGLSMGGMIAIDFAIEHPERVASLVLVGAGVSGFQWDSPGIARYVETLTEALEQGLFEQGMEIFTRYWYDGPHRQPGEADPAARAKVRTMLAGSERRWEIFQLGRTPDPPAIQRLAEITAPTLVVFGTLDMPEIGTIADTLAERLPDVERVDIPGVAHMVNMEAPEAFNDALLAFLARKASTR